MTFVGTLRTCGAPVPLTWVLGTMYTVAILLMVLVGAILIFSRIKVRSSEIALRSLFDPGTEFIGKDYEYLISKAGPSAFFGSMDHGEIVAQWQAGNLIAEAWFQSGFCTDIYVRLRH